MYNPFNSFILFFHKWTNGTRLDIAKAAASLLVCVGCILVLWQWNKIPVIEDEISVEKYGVNDSFGDSLHSHIDIRLKHAYTFTNSGLDSSLISVSAESFVHDRKIGSSSVLEMDSILRAANLQQKICKDSIASLYVVNAFLDTEQDFLAREYENQICDTIIGKDHSHREFSLKEKNGRMYGCNYGIFAIHKRDNCEKYSFSRYGYGDLSTRINIGKCNNPFHIIHISRTLKNIAHTLRLNDISQSYYKLHLNTDFESEIELSRLAIDFGGATRFAGISPAPDEITESGIIYTDKKKIERIRYNGLELFCQFLETANIQSIRIYLLTTIATLFFGIFIKILIEIAWRRLSPWLSKQAEKKRQSKPTSEQTS